MVSLDDQPTDDLISTPETVWAESDDVRRTLLMKLSKHVVEKYICCSFNSPHRQSSDVVHQYARNLLSIGCTYLLFKDAIKEGRHNYANEALNLLCQYNYDLPAQQVEQLIWSRFVNTTGIKGGNIPADLHLEHLNRILKGTVQGLGSNKHEEAIVRSSKEISAIKEVIQNYDQDNTTTLSSSSHHTPAIKKEIETIVKELRQYQVFDTLPG